MTIWIVAIISSIAALPAAVPRVAIARADTHKMQTRFTDLLPLNQ
jgi:hypothetical protein